MQFASRRQFLVCVGSGVGRAALGVALAQQLGFAERAWPASDERLSFGALDPLVDLIQETEPDALMPLLVSKLRAGTPLAHVVGATALANARAFGGTHYDAYHALMALMPSLEMAAQMPKELAPLPVLKVVHRTAVFIQKSGRAEDDELGPVGTSEREIDLLASIRQGAVDAAEQGLAQFVARSREQAYESLQSAVRDELDVHRVVLSWRAYDTLRATGSEHAVTLLRQSVRYCIDDDDSRARRGRAPSALRTLLPELMEQHQLVACERGTRKADDAWIERLGQTVFSSDRAAAAQAVAAALSEGFDPEDVGCALSLASAQLLLNDPGRAAEEPGKPRGSVHGASVGVHASDAANAWRHIARMGSARHAFASLIAGAFHTAGQAHQVGARAHHSQAENCPHTDAAQLLELIDARVRDRDQLGACAAARRYAELGHDPAALFAKLLPVAVSEDGALHAEKYFVTAQEEHAAARPAHRARFLVALTRVMASHYGFPARGCAETRRLLAV
jgi:hypothetical protein